MTRNNKDKINVQGLKKEDVKSYEDLFNNYNKKVYYFALSYLKNKDQAEDVVQEVFMNIWRFRNQINEYSEFSKYLFKITYNETCKKFRKLASDKKHIEEVSLYRSIEDNTTKHNVEYNNLVEFTNRLIEKLPDRQKEIFLLSISEQFSADKIAEKLNISKKTVENQLAIVKKTLRKDLEVGGVLSVIFIYLFIR